jgi:signal transduction histidine kinase
MSTANSPSSHDSLISLTSLYKAVSRFASTTDHRELLKEIVAVAAQQMSADNVTFHEYDPGAQQFYDIDHSVTYGATSSLQRPREKGGGSAYVIEQGEYIVEDVSKEDPTLVGTKHMAEEGVKAFFGIRLQVDGDIVGVLLINYNKPHQFSEAEKVVARILAGYASNAIRNARQGRLQALSQVGRKLASTLTDYQGLLKEIVAVVAQQIGADNVTLHQYDPVARQFYDVERSVTYGATSPLQRPREKGGVSAYVIEQGEYVVGDVSKEDPIVVGTTHLAEEEVKAFLGIRLQVGEDIVGVLLINYDEPHRFSEDEETVARTIAAYASIVIHQQREQAKRLEAEKETAIHEFATKLAHAAVNKVSLARLAALRLLEDSSLSLSPSQRDKLETIVSSAEIANGVIRNFIEPLREVTPEWVSVLKLMKEALHIVGEPTEAKIQIGSLPEHPLVFIEKRGAVIIFSELIINALKAISRSQKRASQGLIEIASSFAPDIGFMEITFSNNGPSIPREYWEKIFEGIVVETSGGVQKGSGLGLWSAREFMQKHGGDVLLKESNDNKTTFVVRLPVSSS